MARIFWTVEQAGRFTATKRACNTWDSVIDSVVEFINATTTDEVKRAELFDEVMMKAGYDQPVTLPNGKTLSIVDN